MCICVMCICMCASTCKWAHIHMCACISVEAKAWSLPGLLSTLYIGKGSLAWTHNSPYQFGSSNYRACSGDPVSTSQTLRLQTDWIPVGQLHNLHGFKLLPSHLSAKWFSPLSHLSHSFPHFYGANPRLQILFLTHDPMFASYFTPSWQN